jgi:predicted RecB family nuclease
MITHLSQSSLQDYTDCPRRFKLRYLDRLSFPAEENEPALKNEQHIREGEEFHRLVQQSLLGIPATALGTQASSASLARWWLAWLDFRDNAGLTTIEAKYVELTLSAPLGTLRLLAKYDLITRSQGGAFIIYDWKTYRRRPPNDWLAARLQTRVYRALLAKGGAQLNGGAPISPDQIEMLYWFADFPTEPARFSYNEAELSRDWAALLALAGEIVSAADFPLTEDLAHCQLCPYRSFCDRGVQPGWADNVETELEWQDINLEQIQEIEF